MKDQNMARIIAAAVLIRFIMEKNYPLFVKELRFKRSEVADLSVYPYNIPLIKTLETVKFEKPVTFFAGENASGKSTILEAIALNMGLNAEGGSENACFETINTSSELYMHITLVKSGFMPRRKYFLRAESFYTLANAYKDYLEDMHAFSHGEEFLRICSGFSERGFYLLDEPESALSPQSQMRFLCLMDKLAKDGAQFIIVTHSPILLSYYDGQILNSNDRLLPIAFKDTEIYNVYQKFLSDPDGMQNRLFKTV